MGWFDIVGNSWKWECVCLCMRNSQAIYRFKSHSKSIECSPQ